MYLIRHVCYSVKWYVIWMNLIEVIPLCINSIYLFYHIFPSTQHTSFEFTATCFDLTSPLQAYLWTLTSYNLPVRIWDPRCLTCVFAYDVISMFYCIYVCIEGWRVCCCCSRGPGPSWFSVFWDPICAQADYNKSGFIGTPEDDLLSRNMSR